MTLYLTACSGYLIVAYLVGSKLTGSQNFIISTLFCFMASVMTYAFYSWTERAMGYLEAQVALPTPVVNLEPTPVLAKVLTAILALGIVACLKFMWDIRHSKAD
jgi:hypothetical protein